MNESYVLEVQFTESNMLRSFVRKEKYHSLEAARIRIGQLKNDNTYERYKLLKVTEQLLEDQENQNIENAG